MLSIWLNVESDCFTSVSPLTLSQTANSTVFKTEKVCRRQIHI